VITAVVGISVRKSQAARPFPSNNVKDEQYQRQALPTEEARRVHIAAFITGDS
jgi:hypothetical protein